MTAIKKTFFIYLIVLFVWIAGYACFVFSILTMKPERPDEITDAIVVLTGGPMRIETGLDLFSKGRASHLFITGVHPQATKQDITHKWSGDVALPPCCITLGHHAETTEQNAEETRAWLADKDFTSIRLVTANFHMNRAKVEFHHTLPGIEIIANPIEQPSMTEANRRFWELSFIEYHKTIFRRTALLFKIIEPLGLTS